MLRQVHPPSLSLRLYEESGALAHLYPELQACVGAADGDADVWTHLLRVVDDVPQASHRAAPRRAAARRRQGGSIHRRPRLHGRRAGAPGDAAASSSPTRRRTARCTWSRSTPAFPRRTRPEPELRRWLRRIGRGYVNGLFRLRIADLRARSADDPRLEETNRCGGALRRAVGRGAAGDRRPGDRRGSCGRSVSPPARSTARSCATCWSASSTSRRSTTARR